MAGWAESARVRATSSTVFGARLLEGAIFGDLPQIALTQQRRSALRHKSFLQRRRRRRRRRQEGFVADNLVPLVLLQISRQQGKAKTSRNSRTCGFGARKGKKKMLSLFIQQQQRVRIPRSPCLLINEGSGAFHLSWATTPPTEQRSRSLAPPALKRGRANERLARPDKTIYTAPAMQRRCLSGCCKSATEPTNL